MAVRIRLRRVGAKKKPQYRLVVADSRSPRDGRFIETVGHYNPLTDPPSVTVKQDRVQYWMQHGALPSDAAAKILRRAETYAVAAAAGQPVAASPASKGAVATASVPAAPTSAPSEAEANGQE